MKGDALIHQSKYRAAACQRGGITIIAALVLLVIITVAAMGMSRNALREVIISGTSRQGSMVRNEADAGIEWSIYWLDIGNIGVASQSASKMKSLRDLLLSDETKAGVAYDVVTQAKYSAPPSISSIASGEPDWVVPTPAGSSAAYSISLTRMGKLPIVNMSQGTLQGSFSPARGTEVKQAPDIWGVRSDAQLQVGSGAFAPTFVHAKEAWITTPVQ
ncbi:MAG: hypothetical protein WCR20_09995 [Verrucomicrobiota bacterium]